MAIVKIHGVEQHVPAGTPLKDLCQEAGLDVSCQNGVCGSCLITVRSGAENLSPLTSEEQDLGLDGQRRLACQCTLINGTVDITFS